MYQPLKGGEVLTASMPVLFVHGMHRGKRWINSLPISVFPAVRATIKGVSQSAFREMPSSSCPASIRNSYAVAS